MISDYNLDRWVLLSSNIINTIKVASICCFRCVIAKYLSEQLDEQKNTCSLG
jgi:hypothetical protein